MKYIFYVLFFLFCAATSVTAQTVSQVRSQSTNPTYTPSGAVTAPPLCYNRTTHHLWGYAGGYWYDLTSTPYVDLDPSPTNEKIVSFSVVAGVLRINENGIFYNVPINDIIAAANISSSSPTITVTNVGGVVTVTSTDPDEDATNELQNLSLAGQTLSISSGNSVALPVVGVAAGTGISVSTIAGVTTVTNTSPDQTVTVTGAGINTITGTYPNFTVTGTEVDGDITNECNTAFTVTVDSLKITDNCGTLGVPLSAFGTPTFADNGLKMAGDTVHLGGSLHQNTTVTQDGYEMIFTDIHPNGDVSQIYQGENFLGVLPAVGQSYVTPTGTNSYVLSTTNNNFIGVENANLGTTFRQANTGTSMFTTLSTNDGTNNSSATLYADSLIINLQGTTNNTVSIYDNSIKSTAYPQTRDDSGTTPPVNFLYTDANGVVQSAPTAAVQDTSFWRLTGNAGTDGGTTNFLGTTDAQDLVLKTNGVENIRIGQDGNVALCSNLYVVNTATGQNSLAFGSNCTANAPQSTAFGQDCIANGGAATAWGSFCFASGESSTAFGTQNVAPSYGEVVTGYYSTLYTPTSPYAMSPTDRLFSIGNGDQDPSNSTLMGIWPDFNNALTMWKDGRSMWNGDVAKTNTWIGVNGTNAQNFINVTTPTGALAAISTEHTPSGNYAVLGSNNGNSGLVINNTKQFAFTTTAGTTSTALGATTTVANYSSTGFLFGGGGAAAANLHLAGSEACDYTVIAATTTLLPTNRMVYVNNGAANITITIPAGDKLLYTIARQDNTSTGTITVQLAGGTIMATGGTIGATTSISTVAGQRSETFHVTGTVARRTINP